MTAAAPSPRRQCRAPMPIRLALFWITPHGRATIHAQAVYDAHQAVSLVGGLTRRIELLEHELEPSGVIAEGARESVVDGRSGHGRRALGPQRRQGRGV